MGHILAQCSAYLPADTPILLAVLAAGLLGSASHCSVMCSPAVMTQMLDLNAKRQPQWLMLFYHAGRITIYMALGVFSLLAARFVFGRSLGVFASAMILLAGVAFVASALMPRKTHHCCDGKTRSLLGRISRLSSLRAQYFLRGTLMGFMPCGLLVSVLLLAGASQSPLMAAAMMLIFGISTVPVLQLAGLGVLSIGKKYPVLGASVGRTGMAMNGLLLCGVGLNLVNIH